MLYEPGKVSDANGYVDHANNGCSGSIVNIVVRPIPSRNDEELNANLCGNDSMAFIPKYMENSPLVAAMHKRVILEKNANYLITQMSFRLLLRNTHLKIILSVQSKTTVLNIYVRSMQG